MLLESLPEIITAVFSIYGQLFKAVLPHLPTILLLLGIGLVAGRVLGYFQAFMNTNIGKILTLAAIAVLLVKQGVL